LAVSQFEDRAEIEYLHSLFAHAADRADYELLRSLYTDDATDDHGAYSGPVDGYIEWVKEIHQQFEILSHIESKPLIFIDGDTAESEIKSHVYLRLKGPPTRNTFSISRIFDKYRKTPRGWRFTSRAICADWFGPEFEAAAPVSGVGLRGTMGPDDPFFTEVPRLAAALRDFAGSR